MSCPFDTPRRNNATKHNVVPKPPINNVVWSPNIEIKNALAKLPNAQAPN